MLLGVWVVALGRAVAVNHGVRLRSFPATEIFSEAARPRDAAQAVAMGEAAARKRAAEERAVREHEVPSVVRGLLDGDRPGTAVDVQYVAR